MLVKRYEAKDMKQAMDDIIRELGTDAIILSSRKVRKSGVMGLLRKPMMEVTVAYEPKKNQPIRRGTQAAAVELDETQQQLLQLGQHAVRKQRAYAEQEAAAAEQQAAPHSPAADFAAALQAASPPPLQELPQQPIVPQPIAPQPQPQVTPSNDRLEEIDTRLFTLDHTITRLMDKFTHLKRDVSYDFPPDIEAVYLALLENQVREELALALAKETQRLLSGQTDATAIEVAHHLIAESIGPPAHITPKRFRRKVILLLGPTGVGKTTSLVKLASDFAVRQKKRVGIINTDTYRIAAHEQLRTYADILDIPLAIAYRPSEVVDALADMADRDVIFLDTAGKRPGDPQHKEEMSTLLKLAAPEEVLLCISATTAHSSMCEIVDTYDFVGEYKLVITKIDETKHRGMILNACHYAKRPLAYVTTGQTVPDDMEIASADTVASQILER